MRYDPEIHHRRSVRLPTYDYRQTGVYFVTLCGFQRACLFGELQDGSLQLNEAGTIAQEVWLEIPQHFPHVELDEFVVMPNHLHGLLVLVASSTPDSSDVPSLPGPLSRSLGAVVGAYKSATSRRINTWRGTPGVPVWQRNYYEHIVRSDEALVSIRRYIADNPHYWAEDEENPERSSSIRS